MSIITGLSCDVCGSRLTWVTQSFAPSAGLNRKDARQDGWHTRRVPNPRRYGGKTMVRDVCPICWAAGRR